jgi:Heavy metal binding domain
MKTETHSATAEHGSCPHCGTDPQPNRTIAAAGKYTCPMHPEVISDKPGACPICGMALEPTSPNSVPEDHSELEDLTRRFWIGAVLTLPVFLLAMGEMVPGLKQISGAGGGRASLFIVGGLAVPEKSVEFCNSPKSEHVHADLAGYKLGVSFQRNSFIFYRF